jgi:hypothetical protein
MKEAMRRLGNQLRPRLPLPAQLTHGTVTAVDTGTDTISVDLGDPLNPTQNVPVLPGYYPTVGDFVLLHRMGPYLVAAGPASPVTAPAAAVPLGGDVVQAIPGASVDTGTSGSFATWLTLPSVTVPAGASACRFQVLLAGILAVTAGSTFIRTRFVLGGVAHSGQPMRYQSLNIRFDLGWGGRVTGLSAGSVSPVVEYLKGAGTGAFRGDPDSHFSVSFDWEA